MRVWILAIGAVGLTFAASPAFATALATARHARFPQAQNQEQPEEIETFTGVVTKNTDNKFVLEEDTAKAFYLLDDQAKASKFAGQHVKVVGRLDAARSIIHVKSIEKAS